jgi:hypothetical protein
MQMYNCRCSSSSLFQDPGFTRLAGSEAFPFLLIAGMLSFILYGQMHACSSHLRLPLVCEKKIFGITSDVSEGCREEFLDTNKKINYITRQKITRRI